MSRTRLLITLGPGFDPAPHGDIVVLDWEERRLLDGLRYVHRVYGKTHKGVAGCSWQGQRVLAATEAELLELDVAPLRLATVQTFPFLNDVHHVAGDARRMWVANTGLDCIEELDRTWRPVATHDLVRPFGREVADVFRLLLDDGRKSWQRMRGRYEHYAHLTVRPRFRNVVKLLAPDAYRRNGRDVRFCDFRPHVIHPNHVLPVGDDVWVTLWRPGRIVSLRTGAVLAEDLGRPHDGVLAGDRLYVTDCANNRLIAYRFDPDRRVLTDRVVARQLTRELAEGFLRGVAVVGDRLFVGFTARRGAPDRFRRAHVLALDRGTLEPVGEWQVPPRLGLSVFSILDAGRAYG